MTPELFIFDCDGVLIDSETVASRVFWNALESAGIAISHADVQRRFTGYSETDAKRICTEELGLEDCDAVFARAQDHLYAEFARSLAPMPGMTRLVASLKGRKCVASNSTMERLRNSLGLFELWSEFAPNIFSADMVARPKPAPDLFLLCAERLGVDPERCVVIDDSPHGITGAVAAGMTAIGFVDPASPLHGRDAVLTTAGAAQIATGAKELEAAIERAWPGALARSSPAAAAIPTLA